MRFAKISLMGHAEVEGLVYEQTVLGKDMIAIKRPIYDAEYSSGKVGSSSWEVLKKCTGQFKDPLYFASQAIYSIEPLKYGDIMVLFDENKWIDKESDLPF